MSRMIPTLGYRSQKAAIEALSAEGVKPIEIAARVGTSTNVVHRSLADFRRRNGIVHHRAKRSAIQGKHVKPHSMWELPTDELRRAIAKRASDAAAEALK